MDGFWLSLAVVFVAELGDKSQLMALAFATRYRPARVLIGISIATLVMCLAAVLVGSLLSSALPTKSLEIVAGIAFLAFAVWTLREHDDTDETVTDDRPVSVVGIGLAFLVAEIGDKTMLATLTLAMTGSWLGVWLGSSLGMIGAVALAVVIGHQLGTRLPRRAVRLVSVALFAIFGVLLLAGVG